MFVFVPSPAVQLLGSGDTARMGEPGAQARETEAARYWFWPTSVCRGAVPQLPFRVPPPAERDSFDCERTRVEPPRRHRFDLPVGAGAGAEGRVARRQADQEEDRTRQPSAYPRTRVCARGGIGGGRGHICSILESQRRTYVARLDV